MQGQKSGKEQKSKPEPGKEQEQKSKPEHFALRQGQHGQERQQHE
jgi:hypothetical protein